MPSPASETARTPREHFKQLIDSFESYVRAEKEKGVAFIPASSALVAALASPIPPPARPRKPRIQAASARERPPPELVFLDEGPDTTENTPEPALTGEADQLLGKMIAAMGYTRDDVIIANREQLASLKPKVIVTLGATALNRLMGPETASLAARRGQWLTHEGAAVMPTFHPAYLLHMPEAKKEAWADLKAVLKKLGRTPPPVKR